MDLVKLANDLDYWLIVAPEGATNFSLYDDHISKWHKIQGDQLFYYSEYNHVWIECMDQGYKEIQIIFLSDSIKKPSTDTVKDEYNATLFTFKQDGEPNMFWISDNSIVDKVYDYMQNECCVDYLTINKYWFDGQKGISFFDNEIMSEINEVMSYHE